MKAVNPRLVSARGRQNLLETMKEEAFAFAQCKVLSRHARKQRLGKLAALLERIGDEHYLKHFTQLAELLGLSETNQINAGRVFAEESFVIDVICKLFADEATQDGDAELARQLNETRHDELLCRLKLGDVFKAQERGNSGNARKRAERSGKGPHRRAPNSPESAS